MIENNLVINAGKQILYDDRAYDGYHNDGWYAKIVKRLTAVYGSL